MKLVIVVPIKPDWYIHTYAYESDVIYIKTLHV